MLWSKNHSIWNCRLTKEKVSYEKEVVKTEEKVEKMKEDKKDEYEIKKMVSLNLILIRLQSINIGPHERHKLMFIKMTVLSSIKIILSFLYKKKMSHWVPHVNDNNPMARKRLFLWISKKCWFIRDFKTSKFHNLGYIISW